MGAPTIETTTPADGATDLFVNDPFTIVFSEAVAPASVSQNTVRLTHLATGAREWCDLDLSADGLTLVVRPRRTLTKNESYRLRILGDDTGLSAKILSAATADAMAVSTVLEFQAGDDVRAWSAEKTDQTIEREGELRLPADLQVVPGQRLAVVATSPTNHSAGLGVALSQIAVRFNAELDPAKADESWMTVNVRPLMGYAEYLAKDRGDGTLVFAVDDPEWPAGTPVDFSFPTGNLSVSGAYLVWDRDPLVSFPLNCEVEVLLGPSVADVYGGTLLEQRRFVFTVETFPLLADVYGVERELPTLPEHMDRDLIHAMIWQNSIRAWQIAGGNNPPRKAWQYYRQFVHARTCLDILDDIEMPKTFLAGQRKTVGDFTAQFDANAIGKRGLKYQRLERLAEEAERAISGFGVSRVAVKGWNVDRPNWRGSRTGTGTTQFNMSSRPGLPVTEPGPVANTAASRASTLPGRDDGWN